MDIIYTDLIKLMDAEKVKVNEPLSNFSYTKTGGPGDYVVTPTSYEEVHAVYKYALSAGIPVTILGNGSNLIVRDGGIRGIVMILTGLDEIRLEDGVRIVAQSGAAIIETSRFALEHRLTGLEFACGIPGSVGGALYMNAGAYGGEVSDVLKEAIVINGAGELVTMPVEEMDLAYRSSRLAREGFVVLEATFELKPGVFEDIKAKMDDLTFQRESKQPLEYPSCGSVFKRPPGLFAGKLIQDAGLQGVQIGGAQVSTKHAGFIVNVGGATATDYLELIAHVQKTVKEKFGVDLETEVKIIGED
ncbi:UDP-N-acetylmuramate dehydrogenase [Sutcliffiella cohnii]|uniref:UDP-N-acetylmuramate dehydrogenase n=1 Tax=Sutcliffiella cohnii TaxID=33932 RepID=UPI002E216A25|nr:UDP-N-acetylmuramate dehydrogenase [Sutcliffiella cohnii]MED4016030.1 UDP-N-acetylmuramate dehydrogenase [Sutcliffiella cohnii]